MYSHLFTLLLLWTHPDPRNVARLTELQSIALDVASTDADETEGELLVSIAIHESNAHAHAVGRAGERGPWQVMPPGKPIAAEALRLIRWSFRECGGADLFAGCRACGHCPPGLLASLTDPAIPRR